MKTSLIAAIALSLTCLASIASACPGMLGKIRSTETAETQTTPPVLYPLSTTKGS